MPIYPSSRKLLKENLHKILDSTLIEYKSPKSERDPRLGKSNQIGLRHLAFAVDDIETEVRRLTEAGIEFMSSVRTYEKSGKKLVYFHGPDGILLELAEYPKGER